MHPVTGPTLEVLLGPGDAADHAGPGSRTIEPDEAETGLSALYAVEGTGRPWVRANMISTLDGAATGSDGRSGSINGPADLRVFTTLRALADVVLVGAGTVRAEGYGAPVVGAGLVPGRRARHQPDHPALAVVSASGELPASLLAHDRPPVVFTTDRAPGLADLRRHLPAGQVEVHEGAVDLQRVIASLGERGLPGVLTEGGPRLLGDLLTARLVDELCLTTSPVLVGGPAPRAVAGAGWFAPPIGARPAHLLHSGGVLLGRWLLDTRLGA
ncbi:MAG: bifunctional deaminase-reductase domain protein [Actinotalea sp.]|nr:bifunctional deaminase-reductase domain protein [Actinotalea sp.]